MKTLNLHVDYIKFKPLKKALKSIEELSEKDKKEKEVKEALVVLTAVEKGDEDIKVSVEKLIENIKDISKQVNTKNIVLYPYAHLSSNLSNPDIAVKVLEEAEKELSKEKFNVTRAPFGYYKEFELKVKGHPLSELSREIRSEGEGKGKDSEKGKAVVKEEIEKPFTENDRFILQKKMTKQKMSFERTKEGLKSNAEIGRELDLFVGSEVVGSGLPLLTPAGATIKREIERFTVDEELKRGYLHTDTPNMAKSDLYKISGHWQHYRDSMFILNIGDETFALRPMTCPFQFIIYKSKQRSYKELPLKYAEISDLFRNEKSGELMGLTRLRQFSLSDAHIICRPDQLEEEFAKVIDLIKYMMKVLKIDDVWYRFSKWNPKDKEKYIDNPKAWDESQKSMKKILDHLKIKYVEADGEAAFYGPKLDIQYKNIFGKEDTLITVQIDFALPNLYDMNYIGEDNKEHRPMVIHRSSVGCLERTMAYILEKTQGRLPTWLSPTQVRVLSFTDRNIDYAEKVIEKMKKNMPNLRIDSDFSKTTIPSKVKSAEEIKIPYILVVGDKEEKEGLIAVRKGGERVIETLDTDEFIFKIKEEIENKA